ncbi:hypothetical protein SSS_04890 [Sarcoptes scabiei]|uniref:Uncharacterized protein n=1 Tax=Sarcoptes scabiei TaxID=52283 RepID=A0A834VH19_SARSC|nr:hypothetical protein SSS_04890 [Sarcoptes scabiei]
MPFFRKFQISLSCEHISPQYSVYSRISNRRSMRPSHFVERFFPSINLLKETLAFLRRNVPGPIPNEHLNFFERIENRLETLKTFMIATENSVRHRVNGPQVTAEERVRIMRRFCGKALLSHLERMNLCIAIRLMGHFITLEVAYELYRRAADQLIVNIIQLLSDID